MTSRLALAAHSRSVMISISSCIVNANRTCSWKTVLPMQKWQYANCRTKWATWQYQTRKIKGRQSVEGCVWLNWIGSYVRRWRTMRRSVSEPQDWEFLTMNCTQISSSNVLKLFASMASCASSNRQTMSCTRNLNKKINNLSITCAKWKNCTAKKDNIALKSKAISDNLKTWLRIWI